MSQFATAIELRTYMDVTQTTGRYSGSNLDFQLQAASDFLERATGRQIAATSSNSSWTYSTDGRAYLPIRDVRSLTSVTLQGTALVANQSYWLLPARQNQTVYTGIQLRAFRTARAGGSWWLGNPEWFDRNLDSPFYPGNYGGGSTLPNDLVLTGLGGWDNPPSVWKMATLALAGFYVRRPDTLQANVSITPEGNVLNYSQLPMEAQQLIEEWRLGDWVAAA